MAITNVATIRDERIKDGTYSNEGLKAMSIEQRTLSNLEYQIARDAEHVASRLNDRMERMQHCLAHAKKADFGEVGSFLREAAESFNDMVRDAAMVEGKCDAYRMAMRSFENAK